MGREIVKDDEVYGLIAHYFLFYAILILKQLILSFFIGLTPPNLAIVDFGLQVFIFWSGRVVWFYRRFVDYSIIFY
jgi:hypothetical protein